MHANLKLFCQYKMQTKYFRLWGEEKKRFISQTFTLAQKSRIL